MRILTVCTSTNVFGAEVITLKTLAGFKMAGHEQLAVTSIWTDGDFNRRLGEIGVAEVRLPFGAISKRLALTPLWWTANTLVRLPAYWWSFRRVLREFRPDVILWTGPRMPLLAFPVLDNTPSFLIEFTFIEPTRTRLTMYRLLKRKIKGFIAVSEFMRLHLGQFGISSESIHVIKSAAFTERDLSQLSLEHRGTGIESSAVVRFGIVGQIAPNKGHLCLLDAARLMKGHGRNFEVHVFGAGAADFSAEFKRRIEASGLDEQFHWRGYQKNRVDIYSSIDVCVVPSCFGDPFPTVAMEAAAYGLPVIASRTGGLPEIVAHGVTGWLVDPNQPEQLAEKMDWVLQNRAAAAEMGRTGQQRIRKNFTVEQMISQFEALFRSAGKQLAPPEAMVI